jgi:hypothetical protein
LNSTTYRHHQLSLDLSPSSPPKNTRSETFYCVARGGRVGIFNEWSLASHYIIGFRGNVQQKFSSIQEAVSFMLVRSNPFLTPRPPPQINLHQRFNAAASLSSTSEATTHPPHTFNAQTPKPAHEPTSPTPAHEAAANTPKPTPKPTPNAEAPNPDSTSIHDAEDEDSEEDEDYEGSQNQADPHLENHYIPSIPSEPKISTALNDNPDTIHLRIRATSDPFLDPLTTETLSTIFTTTLAHHLGRVPNHLISFHIASIVYKNTLSPTSPNTPHLHWYQMTIVPAETSESYDRCFYYNQVYTFALQQWHLHTRDQHSFDHSLPLQVHTNPPSPSPWAPTYLFSFPPQMDHPKYPKAS